MPWTDEHTEQTVGNLLRIGVFLSAAVVLLGGICFLMQHGGEPADYRVFHAQPPAYRSLPGVIRAVGPSDCLAVIQVGLLLLVATPIARVAFSLAAFALERDRVYVAATFAVLCILLFSLIAEH
jgi:uncharacterized membrane protein